MGKVLNNEQLSALIELKEKKEIEENVFKNIIIKGTPELWIEHNLMNINDPSKPLRLRSYQKEVLNSVNNIALRWGRQLGKSVILSARILWDVLTEDNITAILVAPSKKHINDILKYINDMIKFSPSVRDMLMDMEAKKSMEVLSTRAKDSDAVIRLEFKNGSRILCFQTQNSKTIEAIRGTTGSKIYFEEAAYLDERVFGALSGLITSATDLFMWVQSTPKGKSGFYYNFCENAEFESYHTSRESPTWSDEKEKQAWLLAGDESTFRREYLAEFLAEGAYAFRDDVVDSSLALCESSFGELVYKGRSYLSSKQIEAMPGEVYIGVDWNIAKNGTKIVIFKRPSIASNNLFYQEVLSIEDPIYNVITAVDKLFELILLYNPVGIGVDKGYAAGAIELINRKIEDNGYQWLYERIELVDSGEILRVYTEEFFGYGIDTYGYKDLESSGEINEDNIIKLPFKVFMISILTQLMLTNQLGIGPIDVEKEKKMLSYELRAVKVEKISSNGYPVYSKKDLHKFAAAILGVYVFYLKTGRYYIDKSTGVKILKKGGPELSEKTPPLIFITSFKSNNKLTSSSKTNRDISIEDELIRNKDIKQVSKINTNSSRQSNSRGLFGRTKDRHRFRRI